MKVIKLIIFIIVITSPFILNILRKNLYLGKTSIIKELKETVYEKEREFEELKSRYIKIFSPTKIESIGENIGLKKTNIIEHIVLE